VLYAVSGLIFTSNVPAALLIITPLYDSEEDSYRGTAPTSIQYSSCAKTV
jgi:hypothetical protein